MKTIKYLANEIESATAARDATLGKIADNPSDLANTLAWSGETLLRNVHLIKKCQHLLDMFSNVKPEHENDLAEWVKSELISQALQFRGEGSQNNGHAADKLAEYRAIVSLLQDNNSPFYHYNQTASGVTQTWFKGE